MAQTPTVFCVANQKGGVAKTTSSVNLAASLALSERPTLLIDMDPQGNASSAFGIANPDPQIYDALIGERDLASIARDTELEYLKVVPSGKDLVGAEIELVDHPARERRLADSLASLVSTPSGESLEIARQGGFEFVLIDCPPSLGLLTLNALVAADRLLVPLQAEYYALEGLAHLMDTVERIRAAINPRLELEGILLTMFDGRNNLGRQVAAEVRRHFGDRVFRTVIPRNVRLSEAPSFGKPALLYDAKSAGAIAYLEAAAEILTRYPRDASKTTSASSVGDRTSLTQPSDASSGASENASSAPSPKRQGPAGSPQPTPWSR